MHPPPAVPFPACATARAPLPRGAAGPAIGAAAMRGGGGGALACAAALLAFALCAVGAPRAAEARPRETSATQFFANGVDVFGRPPRCRGCHEIVGNMERELLPRIDEFKAVRARKDERRATGAVTSTKYGELEDIVEEGVAGACRYAETYHVPQARKACEKLLEAFEEEIIGAYVAHGKRSIDAPFDANWEVCREEYASRPLSEFRDDDTGESATPYMSETQPKWSDGDGVLLGDRRRAVRKTVAGTFANDVEGSADAQAADVLAYFSFPSTHADFHQSAMPAFARLGALAGGAEEELEWTCGKSDECLGAVAKLGGGAVLLVRINVDSNELAPPHGEYVDGPQLAVYPRGHKTLPKFMSNRALEGRLTLYDLLYFLATTTATRDVAEGAAALLREARDDALYYRPWERPAGEALPYEWQWEATPDSDISGRIEL